MSQARRAFARIGGAQPRRALAHAALAAAAGAASWLLLRRDRWKAIRCHPWAVVRWQYKRFAIYGFARRLDAAVAGLPPPADASRDVWPAAVVDAVVAGGPDTYQRRQSHRLQARALLARVAAFDPRTVVDLGAGKALLSRCCYEAFARKVRVVALDRRTVDARDALYDPPDVGAGDAAYARVVGDVADFGARLEETSGVVCVSKHLCGSATDAALAGVAAAAAVDACVLAPCCHQKAKKRDYANVAFLEEAGFCREHVGLRGGAQDNDFRTLLWLVQFSKSDNPQAWEHRRRVMTTILGFDRCRDLGLKARRLLEEGRLRYLRDRGFEATLVRYVDAATTPDNLAIVGVRAR